MLLYNLEMGKHEHQLAKMAVKMRRKLPDKIENAPSLHFGNELYLISFMELNSCRQSAYGAMPISYFDMVTYSSINGFSFDQMQTLLYVIPKVDTEYLKVVNKPPAKKPPASKK